MPNHHDQLFRATFSEPSEAAGLLRAVLDPTVIGALDLTSIKRVPGTFVEPALRDQITDLLYTIPTHDDDPLLLYLLLEHQRRADRWMPWRMLRYQVNIWTEWRRKHPNRKRLPVIIPLVVYNGARPWTAPRDFTALLAFPAGQRAALLPLTPRFECLIDDLGAVRDETIHQRTLGVASTLALLMLKHADDGLLTVLYQVADLFAQAGTTPAGQDAAERIIRYALLVDRALRPEAIGAALATRMGPKGEEMAMTVGEQLIQQGRQEAQRGILHRLIQKRFGTPDAVIDARLRRLDDDAISTIIDRLFQATTLDELLPTS
jgi:predicted transposase YdaD